MFEGQQQKRIAFELINPDSSVYEFEGTSHISENLYIVQSVLKKNSIKISKMVSTFDSLNNELTANLSGWRNNYVLNVGFFNEYLLNGALINLKNNETLVYGLMRVSTYDTICFFCLNKFLLDLKWKKFVHALKEDITGEINPEIRSNDYVQSFANDIEKELGHVYRYYEKEFYQDNNNENGQSTEISNFDYEYESEDYEEHSML